jgi:hypothetical protein
MSIEKNEKLEERVAEAFERVRDYFQKEGFYPEVEIVSVTEKSPERQKASFPDWTFTNGRIYVPLFRLRSELPREYYESKFAHEISHFIFKEQALKLEENYRIFFEASFSNIEKLFHSEKMCELREREEWQLRNKLIETIGGEEVLAKKIVEKSCYWIDLVPSEQFLKWRENLVQKMFSLLPENLRDFFLHYSEIRGLDEDLAYAVEAYFSKREIEYKPSFLLYYLYHYMRVLKPERYLKLRRLIDKYGYGFLYRSGIIREEIENCLNV